MIIEIADYDGIIALVNAASYQTFVDEDWKLEQLKSHFISQMNANRILVWQTNNSGGGDWKVNAVTLESKEVPHAEFTGYIEVTEGKLYLVNYTDLTMAAQFSDDKIPADQHEDQYVELANGNYLVKVKQLFDPDEEVDEEAIAFELVFTKTDESNKNQLAEVFWATF